MNKGMSSVMLRAYLQDKKLVKVIGGVYYLTDILTDLDIPSQSPKEDLKKFCEDIQLPFQVPSPTGGKYTIKYVTDRIGKSYLKVLKEISNEELKLITQRYYKETQYPVTIREYFEEGVWETALEEHKKFPDKGSSFNKFED